MEVAGWPSHRLARMGVGIVFQHSRPLHRQTVLENIKLALLPDNCCACFAAPPLDARARAIAGRVGLAAVLDRRPADPALCGSSQDGDRQGDRARSRGAADRRAVRRASRAETADFSELIRELRDDGHAILLVDHNVKSVAALVDRVLAMYVGEHIAEGSARR